MMWAAVLVFSPVLFTLQFSSGGKRIGGLDAEDIHAKRLLLGLLQPPFIKFFSH